MVNILQTTIPPQTAEEINYFKSYGPGKEYEKYLPRKNNYIYKPYDEEPLMLLHEFIFILGRIAGSTDNRTSIDDPTIADKLKILFVEKLKFDDVENPAEAIEKFLASDASDEEMESDHSMSDADSIHSDEEYVAIDDPQRILQDFIEKRAEKDNMFQIDYSKVLQEFDIMNLPDVPPLPKVFEVEKDEFNPPDPKADKPPE